VKNEGNKDDIGEWISQKWNGICLFRIENAGLKNNTCIEESDNCVYVLYETKIQ
jgi:hypothetical protein